MHHTDAQTNKVATGATPFTGGPGKSPGPQRHGALSRERWIAAPASYIVLHRGSTQGGSAAAPPYFHRASEGKRQLAPASASTSLLCLISGRPR